MIGLIESVSTDDKILRTKFVKNSKPPINRKVAPKTDKLNFFPFNVFDTARRPKTNAESSKIIMPNST